MWLSEPLKLSLTHDLSTPPQIASLEANEAHLFCYPVIPFESLAIEKGYLDVLSIEEQERAFAIKSPENRRVFIQARARLRWLLGHPLGIPPQEIPLVIGPYGKPHHALHEIEFNLSHTEGHILMGMARGMALGVDVEYPKPTRRLEGLIREVFSSREQRWFEDLSDTEQHALFLRGWTLKEAWVKATGRGIAAGLSRVEIREDFQGFEAVPEGDPRDYQVFESEILRARIAMVIRGEARRVRYYRGVFEC